MCGRFALKATPDEVREVFGYPEEADFPPRYNIAPTQPIAIVRELGGGRHFALVRWGLVPWWVEDPRRFQLLINARVESAAARPAFRDAMRYRRCLVPASGFYEWSGAGKDRRPYWIRPRASGVIAFAGLWETWSDRQHGGEIDSGCILTTAANATVAPLHNRMPAVVAERDFDRWLTGPYEDAMAVLRPTPPGALEAMPVGPRVNKADNDDPSLIEPVAPDLPVEQAQARLL
jgi:putative SOS response-associated peptidase YedK